jgi:hypothetical protein
MAIKIKIVTAKDFLKVTADGMIALGEHQPVDYELLVDFRDTESRLTVTDLYQLTAELSGHGNAFRRKVALLVTPGLNFNQARFCETCSHNRGFLVDAFADYEKAMRWMLE